MREYHTTTTQEHSRLCVSERERNEKCVRIPGQHNASVEAEKQRAEVG